METGNGNWKRKWNKKSTIGRCSVRLARSCIAFFASISVSNTDSWVVCFVITLVFYLAMVIGWALWVMCFAFTLVLCFVIVYSLWLTSAHACGKQHCNLVWFTCERVWLWENFTWSWNKANIPILSQPRSQTFPHFQFWSLVVCEANNVFIPSPYFTQAPDTIASFPTICQYRNTGTGGGKGLRMRLGQQSKQSKTGGEESSETLRNKSQQHANLSRTTTAKRLHFHFCFQFCFQFSSSCYSICLLCCCKMNWLGQLRGFIPGIVPTQN